MWLLKSYKTEKKKTSVKMLNICVSAGRPIQVNREAESLSRL